jgi:hypothetical protein
MSKFPQGSPAHHDDHHTERRSFFKYSAAFLASVTILPYLKGFTRAFAANTPLSEKDQTAQLMGYHANAKKVDTKKWEKRKGAEGAKQFCHNCQFYSAIAGNKDHGNCTLFPNNTVTANGWCNSWTKKA